MNGIYYVCFFFALWMSLGTCDAGADGSPVGLPKEVRGGRDYEGMEIAFEDSHLTDIMQARIHTDYMAILDSLKPEGRRETRAEVLRIQGTEIRVSSCLLFTANFIYYPGGCNEEYGRIGQNQDGREVLVVSRVLSDRYRAAMELLNAHQDAYEALPDFLRMLNEMNETTLPSVAQLIQFHGNGADAMMDEMNRTVRGDARVRDHVQSQFIREYGNCHYEGGSMLDYFIEDERLYTKVYLLDKVSGERTEDMHVVYDQVRWRLLVPLM
jgi:hypothetical protein